MANEGNQVSPGGIWDGLNGFLDFLTDARDTVFESWAQYNLFSGEGFNGWQNAMQQESGQGSTNNQSWSDPRDQRDNLLIWGGIALAGVAVVYLIAKK